MSISDFTIRHLSYSAGGKEVTILESGGSKEDSEDNRGDATVQRLLR